MIGIDFRTNWVVLIVIIIPLLACSKNSGKGTFEANVEDRRKIEVSQEEASLNYDVLIRNFSEIIMASTHPPETKAKVLFFVETFEYSKISNMEDFESIFLSGLLELLPDNEQETLDVAINSILIAQDSKLFDEDSPPEKQRDNFKHSIKKIAQQKNILEVKDRDLIYDVVSESGYWQENEVQEVVESILKESFATTNQVNSATEKELEGNLAITEITFQSATVSWNAYQFDEGMNENVEFRLIQSNSLEGLNSLEKALTIDGAGILMNWSSDVYSKQITGFDPGDSIALAVLGRLTNGEHFLYLPVNVRFPEDDTAPVIGTELTFSNVSSSSITVNWGAANDNVTGPQNLQYKLVRADTSTAIDTILEIEAISDHDLLLDWTSNSTSFSLLNHPPGTTSRFAVLVKDISGNKSLYPPQSVQTYPIPPKDLKASPADHSLYLSWSEVDGASSYNIYWSLSSGIKDAGGTKIENVTPGFKHEGLTNGLTYYYVITAVHANGESTRSIEVSAVVGLPDIASIIPSLPKSSLSGRKIIYDTTFKQYWAFFNTASGISYVRSSDGVSWQTVGSFSGLNEEFHVTYGEFNDQGYVVLVAQKGYDIVVYRGALLQHSIVFDSEVTVFNGSSSDDQYSAPYSAIDNNGSVFVVANYDDGSLYQTKMVRSATELDESLVNWSTKQNVGSAFGAPSSLVLVPRESHKLLLVKNQGSDMLTYEYDGNSWTDANAGGEQGWTRLIGSKGLHGIVYAMTFYKGELYIGGNFDSIDSDSKRGFLAKWNGVKWVGFGGALNDTVRDLTVYNQKLYIGGIFTNAANLENADYLAIWDGYSFSSVGTIPLNSDVRTINAIDGSLYIGGGFTDAGGIPDGDRIVRWDGDSYSALGPGIDGISTDYVSKIVKYQNRIIVGGWFKNASGIAEADSIAQWDGENYTALDTGLNSAVTDMTIFEGNLIVSGFFSSASGVSGTNMIASWDGSDWSALGTVPFDFGFVTSLGVYNEKLYVGSYDLDISSFTFLPTDGIDTWDGSTWEKLDASNKYGVWRFLVHEEKLHVGGELSSVGAIVEARSIAIWNDSTWEKIGASSKKDIEVVLVENGNLYVGGAFASLGGVAGADNIAVWNGSSWQALGSGLNGKVEALQFYAGQLYVGGTFTNAGGTDAADYVARWDGSSWQALGSGLNNSVSDLHVEGTSLYVGGSFTDASSISTADRIARWDGSNWHPVAGGINSGEVSTINHFGGELIIGGSFVDVAGNGSQDYLQRFDGVNWQNLGPTINRPVLAMDVFNSSLYVGGAFYDHAGIDEADYLARWDGANWHSVGSGLKSYASAIRVMGGKLYIGGAIEAPNGDGLLGYIGEWDGSSWNDVGLRSVLSRPKDFVFDSPIGSFIATDTGIEQLQTMTVSGGSHPSLVVDGSGIPHLTYLTKEGSPAYRYFQSDTWSPETVLNFKNGSNLQLSIDATTSQVYAIWESIDGIEYLIKEEDIWPSTPSVLPISVNLKQLSCSSQIQLQKLICMATETNDLTETSILKIVPIDITPDQL